MKVFLAIWLALMGALTLVLSSYAPHANLIQGGSGGGGGGCSGSGWVLCDSNKASGSGVTSGAAVIDSTGADLILITASHDIGDGSVGTVTDSKGNSYTRVDGGFGLSVFYTKPTTTGTGHTFNYTGITTAAMAAIAFRGSAASSVFGASNSSFSGDGNTTTSGADDPPADNYLLIISAKADPSCTFSIASPYTLVQQSPGAGGVNFGNMGAYYVQPTAASIDSLTTCGRMP